MPLQASRVATGGNVYNNVFRGPVDHVASVRITGAAAGATNLDKYGKMPPGTPLGAAGLVGAGAPVRGVTIESTKLAASDAAADVAAATTPIDVTVGTIGQVSRALMEENLGRALTADEIAGFAHAECELVLLP